MEHRKWILLVALFGWAAPALAQVPAAGSWRDALTRLRQARQVSARTQVGKGSGIPAVLLGRTGQGATQAWDGKGGVLTTARARVGTVRAPTAATLVGESEPNGTAGTADTTAVGGQATGMVDPAGDADYWAFAVTAPLNLTVDVDASQFGSPLDPTIELLAPDAVTSLAFNDDFDGLDSRLSYRIDMSGVYFIVIRGYAGGGGAGHFYTINFASVNCNAVGTESEPNDSPATARAAALGADGSGEICPVTDWDYWSFTATAGAVVELDIDAAALGSPLNSVVGLFASDGVTLLASNDDSDGLDSRLQYRIPASGTYFAVVAGYDGGPGYTYTIHFRTVTCDVVGSENEPNDSPAVARSISLGSDGSGEMCPVQDQDYWSFTATAGNTIELDVDASEFGSLLDPVIALLASDGVTVIAFNDDFDGLDSRLEYVVPASGTYYAVVRAYGDNGGPDQIYTIDLRTIPPGPGDPVITRASGF
ncbi:MAG: PPC domain-containing protein, partial [Candidatus Rokuibacteriota bacterium]